MSIYLTFKVESVSDCSEKQRYLATVTSDRETNLSGHVKTSKPMFYFRLATPLNIKMKLKTIIPT